MLRAFPKQKGSGLKAAADGMKTCQNPVCHKSAVGSSAKSSAASAFSTGSVLYDYYSIPTGDFMKNP
jgi:hypothetical protein